jgi:quercetin dioxygenase-like cupin family protein
LGDAAVSLKSKILAWSLVLVCSASHGQELTPKFSIIMEAPITGQPEKAFALYSMEWLPGSVMPLHTHPGDEYGTVIKGSLTVKQIDGQSQIYTAGQGFHVPAGVVHEHKTTVGTTTIHALVVQKDKKLLEPYTKP